MTRPPHPRRPRRGVPGPRRAPLAAVRVAAAPVTATLARELARTLRGIGSCAAWGLLLGTPVVGLPGPWSPQTSGGHTAGGRAREPEPEPEPPARALLRELTASPRLAGTSGSLRSALLVAGWLEAAGWEVEIESHAVLLSLPRQLAWDLYEGADDARPVHSWRARFDPDARPPGDVPLFSAWSAEGEIRGPLVDVGRGLAGDYAALAERGVDVRGAVALARYGGAFRGVKASEAARRGCVGLLLHSPREEDGAGRGETWPRGPWKPGWAAQRGSIWPIAELPGDPSTPGWPSPAPGVDGPRLERAEWERLAPRLPCLPLGADDAERMLRGLEGGGPGPAEVRLAIVQPRELRPIHNVVARLAGDGPSWIVAGNHRDAWVRGAQDAGSGTVSLVRAAQLLGERARAGWRPSSTIVLGFWDAEEFGLVGSTEWAEAHAEELTRHAKLYVNADAAVSGPLFGASGTPGLLGVLRAALERVPDPELDQAGEGSESTSLWNQWANRNAGTPSLAPVGSGSDYTVFLHHLGLPVLDLAFSGAGGGQYHTAFDDFAVVDRYLDPSWAAHEASGALVAELLAEAAERGPTVLDPAEAARAAADLVRAASLELVPPAAPGAPEPEPESGAATAAAEELREAFDSLAATLAETPAGDAPPLDFYAEFLAPGGLPGRPWYRFRLWAPGRDTGYAARALPEVRAAAERGPQALEAALDDLARAARALERRVRQERDDP